MTEPAQRRHDGSDRADKTERASSAFSHRGKPPLPRGIETPDEVARALTFDAPPPHSLDDVPFVKRAPEDVPPLGNKHRLVVLGDSLTQGFKSFAIRDTELAWPALVAKYGGWAESFRKPSFNGPVACPGMPLNLESFVNDVEWPASVLNLAEDLVVGRQARKLMDRVEDYWERGAGDDQVRRAPGGGGRDLGRVNHNLAYWGADLRDAMSLTIEKAETRIATNARRGDDPFNQFVSAAYERSAIVTLAGGEAQDTAVSLARAMADDRGIQTLVVALGANNILGTVIDFEVRWSGEHYNQVDMQPSQLYNAWTPTHFAAEFDELLTKLAGVKADNVIVFTVPHVTIAPMVHGVGTKMPGDRYFARYGRPWISDDIFNPNRHDCLTGDQIRVLDCAADLYNDHIAKRVRELDDPKGQRWQILDACAILDSLAYRRYLIDDEAQPWWWKPYDLPAAYRELSPLPDTRFFKSDKYGRTEGGLFALDGIHPTTIGYALVAREVMRLMASLDVDLAADEPDFDEVIRADTMIQEPPDQLASVLPVVAVGHRIVNLLEAVKVHPEIL